MLKGLTKELHKTKFCSDILFSLQRPPKMCHCCKHVVEFPLHGIHCDSILVLFRDRIPVFLIGWLNSFDWSQEGWENGKKKTPGTCNKYKQWVRWSFDLLTEKRKLDWTSCPAFSNTSWVYSINPNNGNTKFILGQRSCQLVCLKEREFSPRHTPGASSCCLEKRQTQADFNHLSSKRCAETYVSMLPY